MTSTDRPNGSYDDAPKASTGPGPVAIVGLGRAGTALAVEFAEKGVVLAGLWNRTERELPGSLSGVPCHWGGGAPPQDLIQSAAIVLLAVSDDVITTLATDLQIGGETALFHTSGSMPATLLRPDSGDGHFGGYHPLQSFTHDTRRAPDQAPYCVALEGDARAITLGRALAQATGHPAVVLQPGAKPAYHAAAVLASNGLVALAAASVRILADVGIGKDDAWELIQPLVQGTVNNLAGSRPADALTGPIVRGDVSTIARNLRALRDDPGSTSIYRALGTEAMRLAVERGMSPTQLAQVATALAAPVDRANDD